MYHKVFYAMTLFCCYVNGNQKHIKNREALNTTSVLVLAQSFQVAEALLSVFLLQC